MKIDELLSDDVITAALKKVRRRKGTSGVDMLLAEELPKYWDIHGEHIKEEIRNAVYRPQPAITRLISKPGKKEKRRLEIPCVIDRMILSMINMVLSPYYETQFSPNSFGFRSGLNCHDALYACLKHLNTGGYFIVDLDIKNFFDEVNHPLLLQILERDIKDQPLLHLLKSYVKPAVVDRRHVYRKYLGLSQGFATSPLLANVFLNSFDQFLDERHIRFVRYADDIVFFSDTLGEAEEILDLARTYLTENLKLTLNEEKTKIVRPWEFHYLGYAFSQSYHLKKYVLTIDDEIKRKMLTKMYKHIRQSYTPLEEWWQRLGAFNRGWINYYKDAPLGVMLPFLQLAEQHQLFCFSEKSFTKNRNLSEQYISALFNCKNYSSLTGWYRHSVLIDKEHQLRRIHFMANKFTYWRTSSFYNHTRHLSKKYASLIEKPYYYCCHSGYYRLGFSCQRYKAPEKSRTLLSDFELLIIGILAAGKNMTLPQLYAYLLLKGQGIFKEQVLRKILDRMIEQGDIIKHTIFQQERHPWDPEDEPLKQLECYRLSKKGGEYAREICAPLDFRPSFSCSVIDQSTLLDYYTTTILWNQIVQNYILFCPTFARFRLEFVYTAPDYGKQKIPLYIETDEQDLFFSYLDIMTTGNLNNVFRTWAFYQKQSNRNPIFILIGNTYDQLCKAKVWMYRKISCSKDISYDHVAFSVVHSWFRDKPGIIIPYDSLGQ